VCARALAQASGNVFLLAFKQDDAGRDAAHSQDFLYDEDGLPAWWWWTRRRCWQLPWKSGRRNL